MINHATRYSSRVTILLLIAGVELDFAQISNGTLHIRDSQDIDESEGELVIKVDGNETRQRIFLPTGISKNSRQVAFW